MPASVRIKDIKKQSAFTHSDAVATRGLEQAALALEAAVYEVLNTNKGHEFHDVDFLYWQRRLKGAAMPVSLALSEYRGPQTFHNHFRHDPNNYAQLRRVAGPTPLINLARVCREALTDCIEMVGIQDKAMRSACDSLENALRKFLALYHRKG